MLKGLSLFAFSSLFLLSCEKEKSQQRSSNLQTISSTYEGNDVDVLTMSEAQLIAERLTEEILLKTDDKIAVRVLNGGFEILGENGIPSAYVFNYEEGGYSIISADYRYEPILAYVRAGSLNAEDTVVPMMGEWLAFMSAQIDNIRDNKVRDTSDYPFSRARWRITIGLLELESNKFLHPERYEQIPYNPCDNWNTYTKQPLLSTNWGQWNTYNNILTQSVTGITSCTPPTGCVATAMAQLIRYWQPTTGKNYDYSSMPNNSGNSEVQRLMKDVGESVDMNWGCTGSGANSQKVRNSLENDFNFASGGSFYDYNSSSDKWNVFFDINSNKPVYLAGNIGYEWKGFIIRWKEYSGGHAWIADGYIQNTDGCNSSLMFNMNWGWGEVSSTIIHNGWFHESSWNSATVGNYQYNRRYYKNIHN